MSNHSLNELKQATKELLMETSRSSFSQQVENLLSRYMVNQERADTLKKIADDILDAYYKDGVEGVNAIDREKYGENFKEIVNWLRGKLRGDVANGRTLPQNLEAEYASAVAKEKAYQAAEERQRAKARAQAEAEAARRAALSPEERQKEDDIRMTWAMYGGDPSKRPWGLGT